MTKTDLFEKGRKVPLVEEFYTIQGEGFHTGKPAYFIRIGGCDVGCSWCDTKYSWNPELHPPVEVDTVVERAAQFPAASVVVTGGEPLMVNLDYMTGKLKDRKITTYLETSGAHPLTGRWDWICLSPKKNAPPVGDIHQKADELKVIIAGTEDFQWAEENAAKVSSSCHLFLQPEWSVSREILPDVIAYVKNHPEWSVSLQAHKYMRIP